MAPIALGRYGLHAMNTESNGTAPGEAEPRFEGYSTQVVGRCTIRQEPDVLYRFWRDFTNLSLIIGHPVTITEISPTESHWSVGVLPGERRVEWDAVVLNDVPAQLLAWHSLGEGEVDNAGAVRFVPAPGDEGTEVTVRLDYNPPGGRVGALFAKLSADDPEKQVAEALRRFKALMEAGEIPTTEGQPVGEPQRSKQP